MRSRTNSESAIDKLQKAILLVQGFERQVRSRKYGTPAESVGYVAPIQLADALLAEGIIGQREYERALPNASETDEQSFYRNNPLVGISLSLKPINGTPLFIVGFFDYNCA